jgi:hypothetical protein
MPALSEFRRLFPMLLYISPLNLQKSIAARQLFVNYRTYAAPRCGHSQRYYIFFFVDRFSLYERKNEQQLGSTMLPNILSQPALRNPDEGRGLSKGRRAGKAAFESATA